MIRAFIYMSFFIFCVSACTRDKGKLYKVCDKVLPDTVSFKKDILPIFAANCNAGGCHSGNSPGGHLNLESTNAYGELAKSGSGYIDTLNPKNSLLYSQLMSTTDPMPPDKMLDDCSIKLIVKWMGQKAKNN